MLRKLRRRPSLALALAAALLLAAAPQRSRGQDDEVESLRRELDELRQRDEENRKKIEELGRKLEKVTGAPSAAPDEKEKTGAQDALDRAVEELATAPAPATTDLWSRRVGPADVRLIDISFDILTAAGTSTERNGEIEDLQGGAHDPNKRGFTLQQGELSLAGAVDPYFTGEAHVVFTDSSVELEEAFFTTQALPYGFQFEGGYFFTEFGLINPLHPHAWDWIDQPVIVSRVLGGEGLRSPGFRLAYLLPVPFFSELHFGMQDADAGDLTLSFNGESVGGRPVVDRDTRSLEDLLYLARWNSAWDITDELTALLGVSGLYGPNASGLDGETWIYGADLKVRWRPANNFRGWPFVIWQSEVMKRDYTADWFLAGSEAGGDGDGHGHTHGEEPAPEEEDEFPNDLPASILRDTGFYSQLLYGFRYGWAAGLRFEYASGSQPSVADGALVGRETDPFRDDRFRLSPLLMWRLTEFSRLRLQYNYDNAKHLSPNDAHTFWVGAEVLYGSHAAHRY
jgi:hypothetical protein